MRNILITGGAGFIGYNLARELCKKFKITILDLKKKKELNKEISEIVKKKILLIYLITNLYLKKLFLIMFFI